jgi:hypothetical protein
MYAKKIVKVLDSEIEVLVLEPKSKGPPRLLMVSASVLSAIAGAGGSHGLARATILN